MPQDTLEDPPGGNRCSPSIRCFESLEDAAFLRAEVNALNRRSARPDPFSTFEFFENFRRWGRFETGAKAGSVWFLAAFERGQLVGYLALERVARRILGVSCPVLGFLVAHHTDRPHVVALPADVAAVSAAFRKYLLGRGHEWSLLELHQQDDASALPPPAGDVAPAGYAVRQWPSLENCTIGIRWHTLAQYAAALPKKFRVNLRRQMRALLAAGDVRLLGSSDAAVTPALFELYRSVEPQSWKSRAKVHIGSHPGQVAYFESLLDPGQPMRVSIQILLLDGRPISGLITGSFERGLYALDIAYDGRYGPMAPGSAMLLMGVRQAIDQRCDFFNLLSGSSYYKVHWQAAVTRTRVVQIYRIGQLPFWRRLIGDGVRWTLHSPRPAAPGRFNPLRRRARERASDVPRSRVEASGPERETVSGRIEALIAQASAGRTECLSRTELGVLMALDGGPSTPTGRPRRRERAAPGAPPQLAGTSGDCTARTESMEIPRTLVSSPTSRPVSAPDTPKRSIPQ
jgi:CelD/BcsL family acetyltransferase involved in cellulose biosynthesis